MRQVPTLRLFWEAHKPRYFREDYETPPEVVYTIIALSDPKAPLELAAMGPVLWTGQVAANTTLMWWIDPLSIRHQAGLDESWSSIYTPHVLLDWPGKMKDEMSDLLIPEKPWYWP